MHVRKSAKTFARGVPLVMNNDKHDVRGLLSALRDHINRTSSAQRPGQWLHARRLASVRWQTDGACASRYSANVGV
jgi:hypothetical protein